MSAAANTTQTPPIAAPQWTTASFGGCTLHLGHREVTRNGETLILEPRAFDVLVHLIQHRDRTVTKAELLSACWGESPPSDGALARTVMKVRQATRDFDGGSPLIMTVHRVGYRFVGEVEFDASGRSRAVASMPAGDRTLLARRLVLMPLVNMTGDDSFSWIELGLLSLVGKSLLGVPNLTIQRVRGGDFGTGRFGSDRHVADQTAIATHGRRVGAYPVVVTVLAPVLYQRGPRLSAFQGGPHVREGLFGHVGMAHDVVRLADDLFRIESTDRDERRVGVADAALRVRDGQ